MDLHPLRLAEGSHRAGSGAGCAMNVISWENGDTEITDWPTCSARPLAVMVQMLNDGICSHSSDGLLRPTLLCPTCSAVVLELAHRTVGTSDATCEQMAWWAHWCADDISKHGDASVAGYAYRACQEVVHLVRDSARRAGTVPDDAEAYRLALASAAVYQALGVVRLPSPIHPAESAAFVRRAIDAWARITQRAPASVTPEATKNAIAKMLTVA